MTAKRLLLLASRAEVNTCRAMLIFTAGFVAGTFATAYILGILSH